MANIYSGKNALKDEYISRKKKVKIGGTVVGICFALWVINIVIIHSFSLLLIPPCFLGFVVGGLFTAFNFQKMQQLESGLEGENNTVELLANLPNVYSVVSNIKVTHEGRTGELDNVVIGPNGIFVIETKNHNGTIVGCHLDDKLLQHKIGKGGTPYEKQFYNPIKQVSTHVYLLSNFLKGKGINVWVQGIVYFSNLSAEVEVEFDPKKVPVFAKSNGEEREMLSYITEYTGKHNLTQNEIDSIARSLAS